MIFEVDFHIDALDAMKNYPSVLYAIGNKELLHRQKISIVGSRKANQYAKELSYQLSNRLALSGVVIVSGGAIGIDAIAHKAAGAESTIMVAATGLDKRYPAINKKLISEIEQKGLVLSQFQAGTPSQKYNFVLRNEVVVALGDVLIVSYADKNSGTMRSVEYAKKMGKKIYVLPHRIGESIATNELLQNGEAEAIYDIDAFVASFAKEEGKVSECDDVFLEFCKKNPSYDEALKKFPTKVFEAELSGTIRIVNAKVYLC
ncbi:MAG: DNA-processing protein DprA [Sulfurimonas sp.]